MEDLLFQSGYAGLFIASFLAATLIPLGSEVFVVAMILAGYDPWITFVTATAGNTMGSFVNYYVGKYGARFVFSRYVKVDSRKRRSLEAKVQKWGSPILFFAWTPVFGDPLTVVAGGLNIDLRVFTFWVTLGKAFRYALVILTAESF